jgi:hypothetical protein
MQIGTVFELKNRHGRQSYELEGFMPYVRRDGVQIEMALWRSHCKRCGEPFTCTTAVERGEPRMPGSRRCKQHATRRA